MKNMTEKAIIGGLISLVVIAVVASILQVPNLHQFLSTLGITSVGMIFLYLFKFALPKRSKSTIKTTVLLMMALGFMFVGLASLQSSVGTIAVIMAGGVVLFFVSHEGIDSFKQSLSREK